MSFAHTISNGTHIVRLPADYRDQPQAHEFGQTLSEIAIGDPGGVFIIDFEALQFA